MDDDPIPISLVANYMFCPRRAWLEAVGEKVESAQIAQGTYDHRKVDRYGGAPDADSFQAVNIRHEGWGVSGRLDGKVFFKTFIPSKSLMESTSRFTNSCFIIEMERGRKFLGQAF